MRIGLVAQWIEQLRPKEKVVRSTRTRVTIPESEPEIGSFLVLITEKSGRRYYYCSLLRLKQRRASSVTIIV